MRSVSRARGNPTPHQSSSRNTELTGHRGVDYAAQIMEAIMGFGRGALLWLIGIPLPIILLLALFMHH
jgi:hypothetical protein